MVAKRMLFGGLDVLPDELQKLAQQDRLAENDGERPDGRFREYWKRHAVFYGHGESAMKTTELTPCSAKYEDRPNTPACTKQGHPAELSRTIVVVIRPKRNCKGKPVGRICRFRFKCDWPIDAVACTQTEEGSC